MLIATAQKAKIIDFNFMLYVPCLTIKNNKKLRSNNCFLKLDRCKVPPDKMVFKKTALEPNISSVLI